MRRPLAIPWAPSSQAYVLPGSLLLKMHLGEAPEHVPTQQDVRLGAAAAATKLDGGAVDRLIRHHANGASFVRVFPAAQSLHRSGAQHLSFDDQEHYHGMSRTFRVDFDREASVEALVSVLRELPVVESATPHLCCRTPFAATPASPVPVDLSQAWTPRDMVQAREALAYET